MTLHRCDFRSRSHLLVLLILRVAAGRTFHSNPSTPLVSTTNFGLGPATSGLQRDERKTQIWTVSEEYLCRSRWCVNLVDDGMWSLKVVEKQVSRRGPWLSGADLTSSNVQSQWCS